MNLSDMLKAAGVIIPSVFLPVEDTDMKKWAVVACDQFTSQPQYWEDVEKYVGDDPSALKLILPEVYLEEPNVSDRISSINKTMQEYEERRHVKEGKPGLIIIDRSTPYISSRKGIMLCIDLEHYDYTPGSASLVRATEKTVEERLPPRMEIRKDALFELPHIMVLIDDPKKTVIEPLFELTSQMDKIYDFDLMFDGGHIKAYMSQNVEINESAIKALYDLSLPDNFRNKYGVSSEYSPLLFAVGDGNHSLATAKAHWEANKKDLPEDHPARYALCEIINIHDEGIVFEPIHRVLFNVDSDHLIKGMSDFYGKKFKNIVYETEKEAENYVSSASAENSHVIFYRTSGNFGVLIVENPDKNIEVATLDDFLNVYLRSVPSVKIDYIHGRDAFMSLSGKPGNMGFYLPVIAKDSLFRTVILDGVLPRKTFSMGEAVEKRYYIEMRKIK